MVEDVIPVFEAVADVVFIFSTQEPPLGILVKNASATWSAGLKEFRGVGWDRLIYSNLKAPCFDSIIAVKGAIV